MRIERHGSDRYRGRKTVLEVSLAHSTWEPWVRGFEAKKNGVPYDDGGRTHHDYEVFIPIADVIDLIKELAQVALSVDGKLIQTPLAECVPELTILLACANGFRMTPIEQGQQTVADGKDRRVG